MNQFILVREDTPPPPSPSRVAATDTTPLQPTSTRRQPFLHRHIRSSPNSSRYYFDPRRSSNMNRPPTQNAIYVRTPNGVVTVGEDGFVIRDDHISDDDIAPSRYYERQYNSYNPSIFKPGRGTYCADDDEAPSSFPTLPRRRHHYRSHINNNNVDSYINPDLEAIEHTLQQQPPPAPPSTEENASIPSRGTPPFDMQSEYRTPPPSPPRYSTPTPESQRCKCECRSMEILEHFDEALKMVVQFCEMQRERFRERLGGESGNR